MGNGRKDISSANIHLGVVLQLFGKPQFWVVVAVVRCLLYYAYVHHSPRPRPPVGLPGPGPITNSSDLAISKTLQYPFDFFVYFISNSHFFSVDLWLGNIGCGHWVPNIDVAFNPIMAM